MTRIRYLVIGALVAMIVVPSALVLTIDLFARSGRADIADATALAAAQARATSGDRDQLRAIATRYQVRLWWLDPTTPLEVPFDSDHQRAASSDLAATSLGVDPHLVDIFDRRRAAPAQREHAVIAAQVGRSAGCATFDDERLLVCEAAERTPDGHVVLAQLAAPRVSSRIVDARQGLLWLAAAIAVVGAGFAVWLVRRLTRPLEALERQVVARARGGKAAIAVGGPHEIVEIGRAVDGLATQLETQRQQAVASAADLAHELKGPLARIRLAVDGHRLPAEQREALDAAARTAVRSIDRTIGDLLALAQAEAGLVAEPRIAVDVGALVRQLVAERPPPAAKQVAIDVVGDCVMATIAPTAVTRAIGNLLDNAYQFANQLIAIEVARRDDRARVSVRDDGPGISPDLRPRLFERFASRRPGGTGLGLAFARAVAEAHGGRATHVENELGCAIVIELATIDSEFTPT